MSKLKGKGVAKLFSTSGRTVAELEEQAVERDRPHDDHSGASEDSVVVVLVKIANQATERLPDSFFLGGEWPSAATFGRNEVNDGILLARKASKVHCQVVLRPFRLVPNGPLHEAAFLRDNAKHGTMVNGAAAFRPWHWLQHGDVIGLVDGGLTEILRVEYRKYAPIPGHMVTEEDVAQPAVTPTEAVRSPPPPRLAKPFGRDIVGRVVDVCYINESPPAIYRMRVIRYIGKEGFHHVDSKGLSTWDGESFDDTIDLNAMYVAGHIRFVDDDGLGASGQAGADDDDEAPLLPARKRRHTRAR
mmetsp:Transcript_21594/g.43572  ORF Transcript_21594/g.43572 Transcript_21594/m.43572 type:complete len:302 (-) Transcript_21594:13-918(-)